MAFCHAISANRSASTPVIRASWFVARNERQSPGFASLRRALRSAYRILAYRKPRNPVYNDRSNLLVRSVEPQWQR